MDGIRTLAAEITAAAELGALALLRMQNPSFDEVDFRQACELTSRAWVTRQIKEGNLRGTRRGPAKNSKIIFSRLEIAALKEAERREATFI